MRRHADKRNKPLILDTTTQRVPAAWMAVFDEFSRANMRSMLANNQYRYSTRYQDYITDCLGLFGDRFVPL